MPCYNKDPKRDPNIDNHPYAPGDPSTFLDFRAQGFMAQGVFRAGACFLFPSQRGNSTIGALIIRIGFLLKGSIRITIRGSMGV